MSRCARLALYSHDAQGLGHIRRNLNIANSLIGADLDLTVLLICGSRNISHFRFERSIDTLILPALRKRGDGGYQPRNLEIGQAQLQALRQNSILAAVDAFDPDILIVDKLPYGFRGELKPTLELMQRRPGSCILGLRDIIDAPQIAWEEWSRNDGNRAVNELYDSVWIYGDKSIYNLTDDYRFSAQAIDKTRFTGYLNPLDLRALAPKADRPPPEATLAERTVLCLVGGGQDGYELSRLFLKADLGPGRRGVVVTGPYMSEAHRSRLRLKAQKRAGFAVIDFVPSLLPLLQSADLVVSLGGYNTLCEIIALDRPALVIPRVAPRQEQLVRAEVFSQIGLLDYIHPGDVTPLSLSDWIQQPTHRHPRANAAIDFSGFATIQQQVQQLLAGQP